MTNGYLAQQLRNMLDDAAASLQAAIEPPPPTLEHVPTGYLSLLYPYKPDAIAARVIDTELITLDDIKRLEDLLIAINRSTTMLDGILIDGGYDYNTANRWSRALQVHIHSSIAADLTTHMWTTNKFGDIILVLDPGNRDDQHLTHIKDEDLFEQLYVLNDDLRALTDAYTAFIKPGGTA